MGGGERQACVHIIMWLAVSMDIARISDFEDDTGQL